MKVSPVLEEYLRQIRFLSGDAPTSLGFQARHQVHIKSSFSCLSKGNYDSTPPVLEVLQSIDRAKINIPESSATLWKQPPKFLLKPEWQVAEGGESEELGVQIKRQMEVPEAIYESLSSIPKDPLIAPQARNSTYDDAQTPLIPTTEIEDEKPDASNVEDPIVVSQHILFNKCQEQRKGSTMLSAVNTPTEGFMSKIVPSGDPDIVAAASIVFTAIVKSSDKGSLVDRDLLVELLSDPKMIEKLAAQNVTATEATHHSSFVFPEPAVPAGPSLQPSPEVPVFPLPIVVSASSSPEIGHTKLLPVPVQQATSRYGPLSVHTIPKLQVPSVMTETIAKTPSKDLSYCKNLVRQHGVQDENYYRSLIQQHGRISAAGFNFNNSLELEAERNSFSQSECISRFQESCPFFHTQRGCKSGLYCSFQHDYSLSFPSYRHRKKIRLDENC